LNLACARSLLTLLHPRELRAVAADGRDVHWHSLAQSLTLLFDAAYTA
jgi:hypothetical protein